MELRDIKNQGNGRLQYTLDSVSKRDNTRVSAKGNAVLCMYKRIFYCTDEPYSWQGTELN